MGSYKQFSFGLVGCGQIGKRHASLIKEFGTLSAVCDIDSEKANQFADRLEVPAFYNYQDFIENLMGTDCIVICTPNYLHAEQSIIALTKGFHVLCEKPMALNEKDCSRMAESALHYRRSLLIVKQNRFNSPIIYLKNLLDERKLGTIYSITMNCLWNRKESYYTTSNWKGRKELDGGILFTQFSHFFDILIWLFGKAVCISAKGRNFAHERFTEFEDTIVALMEFETGSLAAMHFSTNTYEHNMEGSLTILGECGSLIIGGEYLNKIVYHNIEGLTVPKLKDKEDPNNYGDYKGSMNNHASVYNYFMQSIHNKDLPFNELNTSIETIKAIESVYSVLQLSK